MAVGHERTGRRVNLRAWHMNEAVPQSFFAHLGLPSLARSHTYGGVGGGLGGPLLLPQ
jgi:hypothetical protein